MWRPLLSVAIALVVTFLIVAVIWVAERSVFLFIEHSHIGDTLLFAGLLGVVGVLMRRRRRACWPMALVGLGLLPRFVYHLTVAVKIYRMEAGIEPMQSYWTPRWVLDLQWLTICFPLGVFWISLLTSQRHLTKRCSQPLTD